MRFSSPTLAGAILWLWRRAFDSRASTLGTSGNIFNNTDFTEVFRRVQPPTELFSIRCADHPPMGNQSTNPNLFDGNFSKAVPNLTISESTHQYIAANIAIVCLHTLKSRRLRLLQYHKHPSRPLSFSTVNEGLHNLAEKPRMRMDADGKRASSGDVTLKLHELVGENQLPDSLVH